METDPPRRAPAGFELDAPSRTLTLTGDWTLAALGPALTRAGSVRAGVEPERIDVAQVGALDTAGALLLLRLARPPGDELDRGRFTGLGAQHAALLELVARRRESDVPARSRHASLTALLERIGAAVAGSAQQGRALLGFLGLTLATFAQLLVGRRKLRVTATVFHMEQVGLDALPIVALLTFLVGAVVAFIGATALRDFGAQIYTVELVAISFLREFGPLLTAILLAGRSGSAFTAQIGSMKSREELDAIQALGLDEIELLVIPRMLALLVMLPLLSFVAMIMGILGGGLVGVLSLDITPGMFLSRLHEMTDIKHFWVGMVRTPVFAVLIAIVGCLEGFKVEGSAESVGRHTTSSVVQSIFLVIVVDAVFAMFFSEIDL